METYHRICIKDYSVEDKNGNVAKVYRGKEYVTSVEKDGKITVFADYWFDVPAEIFAGEIKFT